MTVEMHQIVGWIGMILLLVGYGGRQKFAPRTYALFNLVGAAGVAVPAYATGAWPPFALEVVWAMIAIRDLIAAKDPDRSTGTHEVGAAPPEA